MATRKKRATKKSITPNNAAIGRAVLAERRKTKELRAVITRDAAEALRSVIMELALNGDEKDRRLARVLAPLSDVLIENVKS